MNSLWITPAVLCVLASILVAGALLIRKERGEVEWSLVAVLGVTAWVQTGNALEMLYGSTSPLWRKFALMGEIALPLTLFRVGMSFISERETSGTQSIQWRFRTLVVIGGLCAGMIWLPGWPHLLSSPVAESNALPFGKVIGIFILLSLVIALAQLEQVLRASKDPLRYRIKFVVIGLGGIAGFSILQASQLQVLEQWGREYVLVGGLATFLSVGLMGYGLGRWSQEVEGRLVYISPQALYTSLTFLIVGGYFIIIGGLGELIKQTGWELGEALGGLLVFIGILALVVVLFSRQAKAELRLFLARHFYKSKYDYRLKWIEVTEAFRLCHSVDSILDVFLELLGRTFGADRVTIWLVYEADGRFHQVRSVNIESPPTPLAETHPVIVNLRSTGEIIEVNSQVIEGNTDWDQFIQATQAVLCAPLQTADTLVGFVTLSHELRRERYRHDDFDLLRSITHHVTIWLTQANLMESRTAAAKWEAMSRVSTFYLHDLKTLTAGLSMVAQNAESHGHDPAFQESALKTVANTVKKMTHLISKLSAQTHSVVNADTDTCQTVNVNELVIDTVESLTDGSREPVLEMAAFRASVSVPPDQFKQMLLNLVMNARQSSGLDGEIQIKTEQVNSTVAITIADSGPGIPDSQLRTLFQPFKSTKKDGFGIGLYQCKEIIERSRGHIRVESREGEGTKVCITLPAA